MWEKLLFIFEQIVCFALAYRLLFRMRFSKAKLSYMIAMIVIPLITGSMAVAGGSGTLQFAVVLCGCVVPIALSDSKKWYWLALYPTAFTGVEIIDCMVCLVYSLIRDIPARSLLTDNSREIIIWKTMSVIVMLLIHFSVKNTLWTGTDTILLNKKEVVMYDVVCICIFLMVGSVLSMTGAGYGQGRSLDIFRISSILVGLWVFFLIFYSQYLSREREYQRKQLESYDMLAHEQRRQVDNMIFCDEEIRAIRHDIKAHLTALKGLKEYKDNSKLQEYCDELYDKLHVEDLTLTQDPAIDAVLSSMRARAMSCGIKVKYNIQSLPGYEHRSFDLCTIVSNLLENAIEACSQERGERWLRCTFYEMQNNLCIKVENSTGNDVEMSGGIPVSTKPDRTHHGFGSLNVKRAVEKYKGQLRYRCENGIFEAVVII